MAEGRQLGDGANALRLFFALWPDAATRMAIRRATREAVRRAGGRPVPPENYHLTLAFLGEQPASLLSGIVAAATGVTPPAGELTLERLGHFERARVLWLGPEQTPETLRHHVRALWQTLAPLGIAHETRPFAAHLTLARKVDRAPVATVRPARWPYASFALVQSVLDTRGSRYRRLAEWPTADGDAAAEAVK